MDRSPARVAPMIGLLPALFVAVLATVPAAPAAAARAPVLMAPAMLAPDAVVELQPLTAGEAAANHMQRPLDTDNTVIYDQQFGNSVAAGALLGPFGVAANIAATKHRTEEEAAAMQGKLRLEGKAMASEGLKAAGFTIGDGSTTPAAIITPSVRIISSGDDAVFVAIILSVFQQQHADGKPWRGTYAYYLDEQLLRSEIVAGLSDERRAALVEKVRDGFVQVAALLHDDATGKLVNGRQFFFKSKTLSPRFDFQITGVELPAPAGRVAARTAAYVASAPADRVEIVKYVEPGKK